MQNCTVHCIGHNVSSLYVMDECTAGIKLVLKSANITNHKCNSTIFGQKHKLRELHIQNSQLTHSFAHFFQDTLENLTLENNSMQQLDASTFTKLRQLKQLYLHATDTASNSSFLKPLNASLLSLNLRLPARSVAPETWFSYDALYTELQHVNLSGNNFRDSISNQSFSMLIAVQQLILSKCNISYLPSDTFQSIEQHLQNLDLSQNLLKITTGLENSYFPLQLAAHLEKNLWDCNCSNLDLLHTFQRKDLNLQKSVFCASPTDYAHLLVTEVLDACEIWAQVAIETRSLTVAGEAFALQLYCSLPWSINNIKGPVILQENSRFLIEQNKPGTVNITFFFNMKDSMLYYHARPSNMLNNHLLQKTTFETVALTFLSTMNMSASMGNSHVIYDDSDKKLQIDRIYMEVRGLKSNTNYLFCIVPNNSNNSSPFNCQSWTEHARKKITYNVWINNETKAEVLLILAIILTVCFLCSFVLVCFCYLRKNMKEKEKFEHLSKELATSLDSNTKSELSSKTEKSTVECDVEKFTVVENVNNAEKAADGCLSLSVYESICTSDANNMKILHNNSLYEEYYEELF